MGQEVRIDLDRLRADREQLLKQIEVLEAIEQYVLKVGRTNSQANGDRPAVPSRPASRSGNGQSTPPNSQSVEKKQPSDNGPAASNGQKSSPPMPNPSFHDLTTHEAAQWVLNHQSHAGPPLPMKTAQIVKKLEALGYGQESPNLHNAVFTAMDRKPEIFRKIGPGLWALVEWGKQNRDEPKNTEPPSSESKEPEAETKASEESQQAAEATEVEAVAS